MVASLFACHYVQRHRVHYGGYRRAVRGGAGFFSTKQMMPAMAELWPRAPARREGNTFASH